MKRLFALIAVSVASLGGALFACIGDGPGPLPDDPVDAAQSDTLAPDAGPLPKTITGLALWLDGDDPSAVQRNADQAVIKWADKSGAIPPRDYTPPGAAPKFVPGSMNGNQRNAIFFEQENKQYLSGPKFELTSAEAFIVFWAVEVEVKPDADKPDYGLWQFGRSASLHPDDTGRIRDTFGSQEAPLYSSELPATTFWEPQIFGAVSTSETWLAYFNGAPLKVEGKHSFGFNKGTSLVGASNSNTISNTAQFWFNGYIAEVIIYDHQLPRADHDAVLSYLGTKWGITVQLDGGT